MLTMESLYLILTGVLLIAVVVLVEVKIKSMVIQAEEIENGEKKTRNAVECVCLMKLNSSQGKQSFPYIYPSFVSLLFISLPIACPAPLAFFGPVSSLRLIWVAMY